MSASKKEWFAYVEGPGLLLANDHWENNNRAAYLKIDRVYSKKTKNLNLTNRRRLIIPVNDDEADAWIEDTSYRDTATPRPAPILPKRKRNPKRRPAKKQPNQSSEEVRKHRQLAAPATNSHPVVSPGLADVPHHHRTAPLKPRFTGDCRKANFPNPLKSVFCCVHGYSVDGATALTFQPRDRAELTESFRQLRRLPIHYTGSEAGIAAALQHIREFLITTPLRCLKLSMLSDRTSVRTRYAMTNLS
jgi:hypothetical protein